MNKIAAIDDAMPCNQCRGRKQYNNNRAASTESERKKNAISWLNGLSGIMLQNGFRCTLDSDKCILWVDKEPI